MRDSCPDCGEDAVHERRAEDDGIVYWTFAGSVDPYPTPGLGNEVAIDYCPFCGFDLRSDGAN